MVDIWCVWLDRSLAVLFIIFVIVDIDLLIFQVLVSEVTDEAKIYACNVNDGPALEKLMDCLREEFTANPPVSYHAIMFFFIFKIVSRFIPKQIVTILYLSETTCVAEMPVRI